jgi:hypothetical protein
MAVVDPPGNPVSSYDVPETTRQGGLPAPTLSVLPPASMSPPAGIDPAIHRALTSGRFSKAQFNYNSPYNTSSTTLGPSVGTSSIAPPSLTTRKSATATLPTFELPAPPDFRTPSTGSYPYYGHIEPQSYPPEYSVGNLLTPPLNPASENSAASSAIPTGSTPNSGPAPVLPYNPTFFGPA